MRWHVIQQLSLMFKWPSKRLNVCLSSSFSTLLTKGMTMKWGLGWRTVPFSFISLPYLYRQLADLSLSVQIDIYCYIKYVIFNYVDVTFKFFEGVVGGGRGWGMTVQLLNNFVNLNSDKMLVLKELQQ